MILQVEQLLALALKKNDWPLVEVDGLTIVPSPLLERAGFLRHAFTTRLGGQSVSPLDSFNLGRHWETDESKHDAAANRERLCQVLGLDVHRLTVPGQTHTTNIWRLDVSVKRPARLPDFDGVGTDAVGYPVLLHFADCVPVILACPDKKGLCVMHAGWRGTAGGIVSKGVAFLTENYGCDPDRMVAAVGPAIGSCCFETGADVAEKLAASVKNSQGLTVWRDGRPHPDLQAINAMQLLEAGVRQVDVTSWCTACHPELFYSHRQSKGQTGRQGAIACLL